MRRYFAELIGTFALVFCGTGAIIINHATGGSITHVGVSAVFGLVVLGMIFSVGDVSGAHLNPAVSLGFWLAGRFPGREVILYSLFQTGGALLASFLLRLFFPNAPGLGETLPAISPGAAFAMEVTLTFFLMFVIINVSSGSRETGMFAGVAIGSVVALLALFAGPVTGASMNPARSLGPALVAGNLEHLWIYVCAPPLGAALGILGCVFTKEKNCCNFRNSGC